MNRGQRILLEAWIVEGVVFCAFIVDAFEEYLPFALAMFAVYYIARNRVVTEIEKIGPTPMNIIENSNSLKSFIVVYYLLMLIGAVIVTIYNFDLRGYFNSFVRLLLLITFPILLPVVKSQYLIYRKLRKISIE